MLNKVTPLKPKVKFIKIHRLTWEYSHVSSAGRRCEYKQSPRSGGLEYILAIKCKSIFQPSGQSLFELAKYLNYFRYKPFYQPMSHCGKYSSIPHGQSQQHLRWSLQYFQLQQCFL